MLLVTLLLCNSAAMEVRTSQAEARIMRTSPLSKHSLPDATSEDDCASNQTSCLL